MNPTTLAKQSSPAGRTGRRRLPLDVALGLALVLLTARALGPACRCGFVNYDDNIYVTGNMDVQGGLRIEGAWWAFTATRSNHWHPLTWLSLQLDAELFGQRAWGFHLTNLLLHVANVLLLFALLRRLTGSRWRSALVAALFAVHPLHVESVAWVTERKDVLSTFFWLLTTAAYVRYTRRPGKGRYACVVVFFVLGLLAKPMVATLPCTLLLLDYWPLRRTSWGRLVAEKLPLFLLAAASMAVSLYARREGGGLKSGEYLGPAERLGYAVDAYVSYIYMTFWPADLAAFYPLTPGGLPASRVAAAAAVLVLLTVVLLVLSRGRPYLAVGWLWYLGTLVPVSGVVQLGSYALADRYTYVPSIGLYLALVWGLADLLPAWLLTPGAVLLLAAAVLASRQQVRYWQDSIALWEHNEAVTPDNFLTRTQLGFAYQQAGRLDDARDQLVAAARLRPKLALAHANLGRLDVRQGRLDEAVSCFRVAVRLEPHESRWHFLLAQALLKQGQTEAAEEEFQAARNAGSKKAD
jgi:hypothetical protein